MIDNRLSAVSKVLSYQFVIIILVTGVCFLVGNSVSAMSSGLGGAAAFIPNLYFALRLYKVKEQEPKQIVKAFYVGESGKLVLTGLMFAAIVQVQNVQVLSLLVGYVTALSVFWFALLLR